VIASYYSLFAVMGASTHALVLESLVGGAFLAVAVSRLQGTWHGCSRVDVYVLQPNYDLQSTDGAAEFSRQAG